MDETQVPDKNKWPKALAFFGAAILAAIFYAKAAEVLVALGLVITVHELGHFLVAKASGIRVEVFSLGFGSPIVSFTRGGTRYQIAPIPLGGYVKPAGEFEEKEGSEGTHAPDEFLGKPWYIRSLVLLAGPVMNFVGAGIVLFFLYITVGRQFFIAPPLVVDVNPASAALEAGLKVGDQIIKIDDQWAENTSSMSKMIDGAAHAHPGKKTQLVLLRDGKQKTFNILSRLDKDAGVYRIGVKIESGPAPQRKTIQNVIAGTPAEKDGFLAGDIILSVNGELLRQGGDFPELFFDAKADKSGLVTVELARAGQTLALKVPQKQPVPDSFNKKMIGIVGMDFELDSSLMGDNQEKYQKLSVGEAALAVPGDVLISILITVQGLEALFKGQMNLKDSLSGPVAIARMAHQQAETGIVKLILFMVNISVLLGVMNLLPIPLLDGGTFMFCVIEGIRGKALPVKTQTIVQNIAGALLISVVLFATYNDLGNFFHSFLKK